MAETEVISRTARVREGAHGRIECQLELWGSREASEGMLLLMLMVALCKCKNNDWCCLNMVVTNY